MASAGTSTTDPIDLADSRERISTTARACYSAILGAHTDRFVYDKSMQVIAVRLAAGGDALRAVGFTDRDVLDICEVTAYYAYANRIADGLGIEVEDWYPPEPPMGHWGEDR